MQWLARFSEAENARLHQLRGDLPPVGRGGKEGPNGMIGR